MNQPTILFYHYFFLLIGFFGGNLWGSFFSSFSLPPFFFIIGILVGLEIMSYIYYKNLAYKNMTKTSVNLKFNLYKNIVKWKRNLYNPLRIRPNITKPLYLLKVGIIFGLFVDAFKVGS